MRYRRRSSQEAFGIYRPLTVESEWQVRDVLEGAIPEIAAHLSKYRRSSAVANAMYEMGVTFVEQNKVRKAMRSGLLQRGFEPHRMAQGMEYQVNRTRPTIEVPFEGFSWYGRGDRKLAARLSLDAESFEELAVQKESVRELLRRANAPELEVQTPDHVTILKYGSAYDGEQLGARDQRAVRHIVRDHFRESGIETLTLGGLVLGDSYSQPKQLSL